MFTAVPQPDPFQFGKSFSQSISPAPPLANSEPGSAQILAATGNSWLWETALPSYYSPPHGQLLLLEPSTSTSQVCTQWTRLELLLELSPGCRFGATSTGPGTVSWSLRDTRDICWMDGWVGGWMEGWVDGWEGCPLWLL